MIIVHEIFTMNYLKFNQSAENILDFRHPFDVYTSQSSGSSFDSSLQRAESVVLCSSLSLSRNSYLRS